MWSIRVGVPQRSDPRDIEALWERVYRNEYWRRDFFVCSALGGVEMACWDILGKSLGVPVWRLLGGKCRERVRAYANGWYQVERTPEAIAERARAVIKMGYTALKIDPFGAGSYEMSEEEKSQSVEIVSAVREVIGPESELLIEMHGRFATHTAIDMCHRLAPYRPGWYEEPVPPENTQALLEFAAPSRPWVSRWRQASAYSPAIFISICFANAQWTLFNLTCVTQVELRKREKLRRWPKRTTCRSRRTTPAHPWAQWPLFTSQSVRRTSRFRKPLMTWSSHGCAKLSSAGPKLRTATFPYPRRRASAST